MAQKKYHSVVFVIVAPESAPPNKNTCPCGIITMPAAARGRFIDGPGENVLVAGSKISVELSGTGARMLPSPPPASMNVPFVELDARIEAASGLSLDEIFQVHGESYYRAVERAELGRLLSGEPCVFAVGGGLVTDEDSYETLRRQARTVWLRAAPEDHWRRVIAQGDTRPMADNEQAFVDLRRILSTREPLYERAEVVVDTSGAELDAVVAAVAGELEGATA